MGYLNNEPLAGRCCYQCGKVIAGKGILTNPPLYLVRIGVEFSKAYHARCFDVAEAEAARVLKGNA
jgi:hypothetical protein